MQEWRSRKSISFYICLIYVAKEEDTYSYRKPIVHAHNLKLQCHRYHVRIEMRASRIATFPQIPFLVHVKSVQARV